MRSILLRCKSVIKRFRRTLNIVIEGVVNSNTIDFIVRPTGSDVEILSACINISGCRSTALYIEQGNRLNVYKGGNHKGGIHTLDDDTRRSILNVLTWVAKFEKRRIREAGRNMTLRQAEE